MRLKVMKDPKREAWSQNPKCYLEEVSTTCGSGWVGDQLRSIPVGSRSLTHPLPQVVLTSSKLIQLTSGDLLKLSQSPRVRVLWSGF